ncbi:MAG: hypothetical protein JEZ04_01410 [Spirochaetales bacterium]|nr:hypothetical protein [Spirochaetales bacterium]
MAGKIFYRKRAKFSEADKKPRYRVVAVLDLNLRVQAEHLRKKELEMIAMEADAFLIELEDESDSAVSMH